MHPKTLTIRQIAKVAQVSSSTVSRALRNHPRLPSETCVRIQLLAREMGYRPNPLVSALMSQQRSNRAANDGSTTIAFVTAHPPGSDWKSIPTQLDFFQGCSAQASLYGFALEEFRLKDPGMNSKRLSRILVNRNIQGILLAPLPVGIGHLSLDWNCFAVAGLGYSMARPQVHRAVHNNLFGIRLALRQLRKLGYQRPGLVLHDSLDIRVNRTWSAGYSEYLMAQSVKNRPSPLIFKNRNRASLDFPHWFRKQKPDVIVAGYPDVFSWITCAGLRVPTDLGLVLLDCPSDQSFHSGPAYSGIHQNSPAIGAAAIDMLVGQLNRNQRGLPELPKTTMIEGLWVQGSTIREALQQGPKADMKTEM